MFGSLLLFICLFYAICGVWGFSPPSYAASQRCVGRARIGMEYIPDGLTKKQWEAIKRKEAEEEKAKRDMGAMGARGFKSRSLEAWQKAGARHLFPVDPNTTPYEERPYMQRKGGDWEGKDLDSKGLKGIGQGAGVARSKVDDMYEKAKAEGKLDSKSIFGGKALPWTSKAANSLDNSLAADDPKRQKPGVAGRKRSPEEMKRLKQNLFKPIDSKKEKEERDKALAKGKAPPKKKGVFGW